MNSNYLQEKYPEEGYNKPIHGNNTLLRKPWERLTPEQINEDHKLQLKLDSIKKLPCINVCNCGEEWESKYGTYQEGCYPYVANLCQTCHETEEAKEREQEQEFKKQEFINRFNEMIPPRYRGKLTKPINKDLLTSNCSIIWGSFGTGKTWEAYSVAKELILNNKIKSFKLLTEIDLLNDLKDGFDGMQYKINYYKNIDLLILDEAGKNNDSDFNKAQLFGILNHRYDWEKKTILICNAKDKKEIRELLPTATLDRFRECVVEMTGASKRYI